MVFFFSNSYAVIVFETKFFFAPPPSLNLSTDALSDDGPAPLDFTTTSPGVVELRLMGVPLATTSLSEFRLGD